VDEKCSDPAHIPDEMVTPIAGEVVAEKLPQTLRTCE
jgi:hypothetical protein